MHSSIYIFSCKGESIVSYPHDYSNEIFKYAIGKSKNGAQIVLVRRDNLLHYCFIRKIANKQYFGICLRLSCIYKNTEDLFQAFNVAFANLIEKGIFLKMNDDANIIIHETDFAKESVAITELSNRLLHSLALSNKTTLPLPPVDFAISINDCIELSIEDSTNDDIIRAIQKYSKAYIVKTHDEIARITEIAKLIAKLKEEIKQLQDIVFKQKDEIADLKKQKNKYKLVLFLLAIIFMGAIVFFYVMQSKNDSIYELQQERSELRAHVKSLQKDSTNLSNNLYIANLQLEQQNQHVIRLQKDSSNLVDENIELNVLNSCLEQTITELRNTKSENETTIKSLSHKTKELERAIENLKSSNTYSGYTHNIGPNTSHSISGYDSTYAQWIYSYKDLRINYFYVKPKKSGYITIGLYNINHSLVQACKVYVYADSWNPVYPDFELKGGTKYYLAIRGNIRFAYNDNANSEYSYYKNEHIQLLGSCKRGRSDYGQSFYQYFYGINYSLKK